MTSLRHQFHNALQRLCLAVPYLSEGRLAMSKVLAFLRVWHYLSRNKIEGDYLEFGVWQGMSFDLSLRAAAKFMPRKADRSPRFFAFDPFQGLPQPDLVKDGAAFEQGEYRAAMECFQGNIRKAAQGFTVQIVPGFYEQSLTPEVISKFNLGKAAFVNIDCDLYDSTLCALRFVTPLLRTGSVIFFDDWFFSGGDMTRGEAGACAQWLKENPNLKLIDYGIVGIMGQLFIVNLTGQNE
jgi:hypothetical protein